ncbi:DUF6010 family protein [Planctobacterium marinum]|uniref:DUF6010 family protein n=1 Tax=Planctobacterium marinum TaxID=1631968 RepID=UPI001E39DD65|nr:DUF6010 family protein [Planctobacterium marinum]MCC2607581.1 hypothetical protein [Planctobacterium marinum]
MILLWLFLGLLLVSPLIFITRKLRGKRLVHVMGSSLVIAALIYIGFAIIWGDTKWLATEFVGVLLYSAFYWLALQRGLVWLAIGWLLHPAWDAALHLFGPGAHIAPAWYAWACISFDVVLAAYLLKRSLEKQPMAINT